MTTRPFEPIDFDRYERIALQLRRAEMDRLWNSAVAAVRRHVHGLHAEVAAGPASRVHAPRAC